MWYFGAILSLLSFIAWLIVIIRIRKNPNLMLEMWLCVALMWIGNLVMRLSR